MLAELAPYVTPTLGTLLGLCVLLILTGKLVPVSVLQREIEVANQRVEDIRKFGELVDARNDRLAEQQAEMLGYMRSADAVLQALQRAAERAAERGPQ